VLSDPVSELGFIQFAGCEREDESDDLLLGGFDAKAVQAEEEIHGLESDAFVPVNERVVLGKPEAISRSEGGQICVGTVMELVLRALKCRFKETSISKSG